MSGLLPQLARSSRAVTALPVASASTSRVRVRSIVTSAVAHDKASLSSTKRMESLRMKEKLMGNLFAAEEEEKQEKGGSTGRVLKSSLAHEAADLSDVLQFYPESVLPLNVGKPSIFPRNTYDQLKTFGLPRRLAKELSDANPASVIRQPTLDIINSLNTAAGAETASKDARYILSGPQGTGKSMLVVQAVSYAIEAGWIVLYDPSAETWINSTTQFEYNPTTKVFDQPELASNLLSKLLAVNRERLADITLPTDVKLRTTTLKKGSKLTDLVSQGIKDARSSVVALEATLNALAQQTQFPVLVAIDGVQSLFMRSEYRAPDYTKLQAYQLSTPRLLLDYIAGQKTLKRGALLTALSYSDTRYRPTDSLLYGLGVPTKNAVHAYTKLDETALAYARSGVKRVDVPTGMSAEEAAAMFQLWARKGWASNGSDEVFLAGLTSGMGNPRELGRAWTRGHYAYMV